VKHVLTFAVVASFALLSGCSVLSYAFLYSDQQPSNEPNLILSGTPKVLFAYPNDTPVIGDQSKVATIVYNPIYLVRRVDGIDVADLRRTKPPGGGCIAIDLLPGSHTLDVYYSERIWLRFNETYTRVTKEIAGFEVEVEAGGVYQLKAIVEDGNFTGFAIDRGLSDTKYGQRITETRNSTRQ
jgi:hypothetical protein